MRELYVNGKYVNYVTTADLKVLLEPQIRHARRHRQGHRLDELDRKAKKARQLHERPREKFSAL